MEDRNELSQRVFPTKVDSSGRIVLPRELREEWHLTAGDGVALIQDEDGCRIETAELALQKAQSYFRSLLPPGVSLVDELLAERRAEVVRDAADVAGSND